MLWGMVPKYQISHSFYCTKTLKKLGFFHKAKTKAETDYLPRPSHKLTQKLNRYIRKR